MHCDMLNIQDDDAIVEKLNCIRHKWNSTYKTGLKQAQILAD